MANEAVALLKKFPDARSPVIKAGYVICNSISNPCRQLSQPGFQLDCRGGLMAAEAVALLKEFYAI